MCPPHRLRCLAETLEQDYSRDHEVVLYQAAHFPCEKPIISTIRLSELETAAVSLSDTMCVPPLAQRAADPTMVECLFCATTAGPAGPDDGPVRTQSDVSFHVEVQKTSTWAASGVRQESSHRFSCRENSIKSNLRP